MRDILDREDINEYDKAIKYRGALMRYMHLVDNYQTRPIFRIEFKDDTTTAFREDKEVIKNLSDRNITKAWEVKKKVNFYSSFYVKFQTSIGTDEVKSNTEVIGYMAQI